MNGLARHQIDIRAPYIPHAIPQCRERKEGEALRPFQIKKNINIRVGARLISGDRTKQKQGTHTSTAKFRLVLFQQRNGSTSLHFAFLGQPVRLAQLAFITWYTQLGRPGKY